ncbi:unnamed protein product [Closterium sp. NIES-54]
MLLALEGGPDAFDIPIPRNHAEVVSGPWASYWIAAEEAEMASYRSTNTYIDVVPPPGANVVTGMWLYKVKRPPGAPPVFKARYVARGFSQREGVEFFQTFAPTPKMTTLWVLLHIAAQRDYELHSLDFSTTFLQGSLHEQIWLHRPRLDFFPSFADPSLFVCHGLTSFFVLVYIDDLVFATPDRHAMASMKEELQRRHTFTDLGELQRYLGLQITRDRAARTIMLTHSHMVEQILTRFCFPFSKVQPTPLAVDHGLTDPPLDKPFESSGPYPELVGCLMYLMTCTHPDLAYPLSILARFVAPGRYRPSHWYAAKRVAKYVASTSGMGLVLGGKQPVTLTGYSDSSWADDAESMPSTLGYCFSLGTGAVSWRLIRASSVSSSSCEAEVYAAAMAAQELRWLSFLLTDLGERPHSPPVLFADKMSGVLLCEEPPLVGKAKHIQLRYFLLREFQQCGQARVVRVVSEANTADIFTKALPLFAHQRFCTQLGLLSTGPCQAVSICTVDAQLILGGVTGTFAWGIMGALTRYTNKPFYPSGLVTGILTALTCLRRDALSLGVPTTETVVVLATAAVPAATAVSTVAAAAAISTVAAAAAAGALHHRWSNLLQQAGQHLLWSSLRLGHHRRRHHCRPQGRLHHRHLLHLRHPPSPLSCLPCPVSACQRQKQLQCPQRPAQQQRHE